MSIAKSDIFNKMLSRLYSHMKFTVSYYSSTLILHCCVDEFGFVRKPTEYSLSFSEGDLKITVNATNIKSITYDDDEDEYCLEIGDGESIYIGMI